jgi:ADP-ribose pyrophosphatase YjhB (NUDIX family)
MRTNSSMVQVFPQRKNEYLEQLRFSLKAADYILDETVFRKIQQLFLKYIEDSQYSEMLGREFSESDRTEFLLNVDSKKLTVYPSEQLIKEYRTICNKYKNFRFWFQEKEDKESKRIVLLVARWLAHLAGFRHQCVHIFLDHPTLEGYTLVQIRSFNKSESPGCFDIPIGGHVKDGESLKETCKKELKEELNIDLLLDIEDFEQIGTYNYHDSPQHTNFHNIELRTVFLGRLKTEAMTKIKFVDKEVSAICVFAMPELSVLIKNFPKRIASGLKDSLPVYIQYKNQRKVHNNK